MKQFLRRIINTEYLPMSEVRKLKVTLVMIFLVIITAITVLLSVFLDYPIGVKIAFIAGLVVISGLITLLIRFNKIMAAIQISIIYVIALTLYYTQGTSSFYAYLFFFIGMTIIVFYQELYSYISYGTLLLGMGIYYVFFHQDALSTIANINGAVYVYSGLLTIFYLVFLVQILANEKIYTELNYEWVKMIHLIDNYQDETMAYLNDIRKTKKTDPLYENVAFQKAVSEISIFLYEQLHERGKDIANVFDLYIYLHEKGMNAIISSDEFSIPTKKVAYRLNHYLLNRRTNMVSLIMNVYTRFRDTEPYRTNRYDYALPELTNESDETILALALLYSYFANEVTTQDPKARMTRHLTHEEIMREFASPAMSEFLDEAQIAFINDNAELFKQYLSKKDE